MRILMVCPYPPIRDGIGAYAVQQATTLRAAGHDVEILSPLPSAAHHHLELRSWRGPLALAKRVPRYDRVILHFHVDMFYPAPLARREMVAVTLGLTAALARARNVDLVVHEINYEWGRRRSVRALVRTMLRSARRLLVHTQTERRLLCAAFGLPTSAVEVIAHGTDFIRRTDASRAVARQVLGLADSTFVFLAIGFVQPHKGFDRAIRAFGSLGSRGCRLYIVGSIRVEEPEYLAHLGELRRLAAETPGVELRIEYVSDERFDQWLVAANVVVLPYRYIWSSGVLERSRLYERPVIASDVGGLRDQAYEGVTLVSTDEGLAAAMLDAAGQRATTAVPDAARQAVAADSVDAPTREPFLVAADTSRSEVMRAIRERAAGRRRPAAPTSTPVVPPPQAAPLLRLGELGPPSLDSRLAGRRLAKRLVNALVRWQTEPLRMQVNELRRATLQAVEGLSQQREGDPPKEAE